MFNVQRKRVIRYTITGRTEDRGKAFEYVDRHGLRVILSGPMPGKGLRVDSSRFKIVAEKDFL